MDTPELKSMRLNSDSCPLYLGRERLVFRYLDLFGDEEIEDFYLRTATPKINILLLLKLALEQEIPRVEIENRAADTQHMLYSGR